MRALAVYVFMLLACPGAAYAKARLVDVEEPKQFGYFIGDVLERTALIELSGADRLVTASRPEPGQIKYWLWLRNVQTEELSRQGRRFLKVRLAYQIFYAPLQPQRLTLPSVSLLFRSESGETKTTLPPFTFLAAPLRELTSRQGGGERDEADEIPRLMPDAQPQLRSTARERTTMLLSSMAGVLAFGLLLYHQAWWPFGARRRRPFTVAARQIAALKRSAITDLDTDLRGVLRPAFLAMHRALDETAGQRLLANDQPSFFAEHPGLVSRRGEIGRFFEASGALFFAEDAKRAEDIMPLRDLVALSNALGVLERGQP